MDMKIIYTDILKESNGYIEEKGGILYVLLKEEFRHDKIKAGLIVSELIRKFRLKYD